MKHWTQRQGVWVESDQGVGIRIFEIVATKPDGSRKVVNSDYEPAEGETVTQEPWLHLTNADGTTLAQLPAASCTNVRLARSSSIPSARVAHMTADNLAALGYAS